jgi:hypothetical protein
VACNLIAKNTPACSDERNVFRLRVVASNLIAKLSLAGSDARYL